MATATTAISRTPTRRARRMVRERAKLDRAATLYQQPGTPPATNDDTSWYVRWLEYEYPAPGWGC
jgi:hypothetical protein